MLMRLAISQCKAPSCRTIYETSVEDEMYIRCPVCSQNNQIDAISPKLTGRCQTCKRPIDDHMKGRCP